jgi:hypothetical protein
MVRWALLGVALAAPAAFAHDVSVEVSGANTRTQTQVPRAGNAGAAVSGDVDLSDAWSLAFALAYTRDFATRTDETKSAGSNILLLTAGAAFMPTDHLTFLGTVNLSPRTTQVSATSTTYLDALGQPKIASVVLESTNSSLGASLIGSYATAGDSGFESAVDLSASATHYDVFQQQQVPNTVKGRALLAACDRPALASTTVCRLVDGVSTPLSQVRLGAAYTATLAQRVDLGVDLAWFLYDKDPTSVGFFSLVALGRDVGSGVPLAPYQFTAKPSVTLLLGPVRARLSYQYGLYTGGVGTSHAVGLKVSWKVTKDFKLTASVLGQADTASGALAYSGTTATLGTFVAF